jgi:hypothetical protein
MPMVARKIHSTAWQFSTSGPIIMITCFADISKNYGSFMEKKLFVQSMKKAFHFAPPKGMVSSSWSLQRCACPGCPLPGPLAPPWHCTHHTCTGAVYDSLQQRTWNIIRRESHLQPNTTETASMMSSRPSSDSKLSWVSATKMMWQDLLKLGVAPAAPYQKSFCKKSCQDVIRNFALTGMSFEKSTHKT